MLMMIVNRLAREHMGVLFKLYTSLIDITSYYLYTEFEN